MNQRQGGPEPANEPDGRRGGAPTPRPDHPPELRGSGLRYASVLRRLEADILAGRLAPGERLASERELGGRLGVARNTLRRALTLLEERGLLEARGRHGWVVPDTAVAERLDAPQSLTEWAARQGFAVTSRVLRARTRTATSDEARRLRLPPRSRVFEVERVRLVEGVPLSVDRSVLHPRVAPALAGVDLSVASLWGTLRERGDVVPVRSDVVVRAVPAPDRIARLLEVPPGAALLELSETAFDEAGDPFEAATLLNRGDRYAFVTTLAGALSSSTRGRPGNGLDSNPRDGSGP